MASYHDRFYAEKARGADGPSVTVTAPVEDWIGVNNGDTSPMGLLMQGKLKVKGSLATATKLQTLFKPGSEL